MDTKEDPSMVRVRAWIEASGLSLHEIGIKMGYTEDVARKAVWQFLQSKDPRIGMLRKFASAVGLHLGELVTGEAAESKQKRRRK